MGSLGVHSSKKGTLLVKSVSIFKENSHAIGPTIHHMIFFREVVERNNLISTIQRNFPVKNGPIFVKF